MELLLVLVVVSALLGYAIGQPKGHGGTGLVLGLFLGLIGIVIVAVLPASKAKVRASADPLTRMSKGEKRCPRCAEWVADGARVCRYCGAEPKAWA